MDWMGTIAGGIDDVCMRKRVGNVGVWETKRREGAERVVMTKVRILEGKSY